MPTRKELQDLSEDKLNAVKHLFEGEFYHEVITNSGYPVEFGLKSAVCKHLSQEEYPSSRDYFVHDVNKLVKLANLKEDLDAKKKDDVDFFVNWSLISKWSVEFRYEPVGKSKKENAKEYISALEDEKGGILPWVKTNW